MATEKYRRNGKRRHHNNTGERQIKLGRTREFAKQLREKYTKTTPHKTGG